MRDRTQAPSDAPSRQTIFRGAAVPIAAFGMYTFPDTPSRTTSRLFTPEERALAIARMPHAASQKRKRLGLDWTLVKRVLGRWELWALALVWSVARSRALPSSAVLILDLT